MTGMFSELAAFYEELALARYVLQEWMQNQHSDNDETLHDRAATDPKLQAVASSAGRNSGAARRVIQCVQGRSSSSWSLQNPRSFRTELPARRRHQASRAARICAI
jgi:hypothetical protein